jgi:hypothetical protein
MGAMVGPADSSLYSQLAEAQRHGRPPLPGRGVNRLSAPADLQQQLRAFAAGQPIGKSIVGHHPLMGALPPGGSSTFPHFSADSGTRQAAGVPLAGSNPFVAFNTEPHMSSATMQRQAQVPHFGEP